MMSKKSIFVDTGAWYALSDESDQFHKKATANVRKLAADGSTLITTNLVIHETFMLLARRISRKAAITFLDEIYHADNVQIFHSDRTIEKEAYVTIRKYTDQDFSVADSVSFVIMKREGLKRAFRFDKHFKTMRFTVEP
jgi:predicted nucleic acid-binding protein